MRPLLCLGPWGASKGPPCPPRSEAPRRRRDAPRYSDILLAPDLAGGFHHELELPLLIVLADEVSHHVGREAALRAEGELVQGHVAARVVDPLSELVDGLELGNLRADEPEPEDIARADE